MSSVMQLELLAVILGFLLPVILVKYLDVPFIHKKAYGKLFGYIIDKVRKKLSGWKTRFFSKAARPF